MTDPPPRRLFDGMRFFVTQCAMKTLQRIDDNHASNPAHSDLILNTLMSVGGMVIESLPYHIYESLVFVFDQAITTQASVHFLIRSILQVIVNRVSPKRSLYHGHRFAVRSHPSC
jgi:hypothetical protein